MRAIVMFAFFVLGSAQVIAAPLSKTDRAEIAQIPSKFTAGWLHNSRREVMKLFAADAVFIPHDGVRPRVGKVAIQQFWFPKAAAGTVTKFVMTAEGLSGNRGHAILWGKSDLYWQDGKAAYHWPGFYLVSVERRQGRWLVTHLMSSDEQPTSQPLAQ
jgi:uncharacterized protein (TIGR02246 family)